MRTDAELARSAASGNKKAWDTLAAMYGGLVRGVVEDYLASLAGSPSEAEIRKLTFAVFRDLTANGFELLTRLGENASLATRLALAAVMRVRDFIRAERDKSRFTSLCEDAGGTFWCQAEKEAALKERGLSETLDDALSKLSAAESLVIQLFYFHGMEYEDISTLLRMNIASVTRTLAGARNRLGSVLREHGHNIDDFIY